MTDMTDEQLMEQLKKGDTDSIEGLYLRYAKRLYVLYCTMFTTGSPEDFIHDIFIRVVERAHQLDSTNAPLKIRGESSCPLMI